MWIKSLQVKNYKSFADSGRLELGPKLNVIIGKNNSGKTALLQAVKNRGNTNVPHRDLTIRRNQVASPHSEFLLDIAISGQELFDSLASNGGTIHVPVQIGVPVGTQLTAIFEHEQIVLPMRFSQASSRAELYPSHQLFREDQRGRHAARITPSADRQSWFVENSGPDGNDNFWTLAEPVIQNGVFLFTAERRPAHDVPFGEEKTLLPDASNLPRVLFAMRTNTAVWDRFNGHVNEILPNVKEVIVAARSTHLEVKLWPVSPVEGRDDLIVSLSQSGTGVGQVLSILAAAMTAEDSVICIDEPSNFLHPGAVKALFRVLFQYKHQYIITTHSAELIASAQPDYVYLVKWDDCISTASLADYSNIDEKINVLSEVGINISDVFGADRILWVEGDTEEICIPTLIQFSVGAMPPGLAVVKVRSVDEVLRKEGPEKMVLDIYRRLSTLGGLAPRGVAFLFDRENRSDSYIAEVERSTQEQVHFRARRTFENYLLDPQVLADELSAEATRLDLDLVLSPAEVETWIADHTGQWDDKNTWVGSVSAFKWAASVNAPKLLRDLYADLIKTEYRKTTHSLSLLRRALAQRSPDAIELADMVRSIAEIPSEQSV